ncbi:DEAD/DEAH box helicase (plasmid) [Nostoc sp. C052]|uniref:DEAD/DEAH box helicase n=1 Tax=Nostoc sp. C052 TaxID=2576902 RepID=UPI0015C36D44|nr:DEAD/DEAH box helicase [Nostoc sp. C052]QLE46477.1 DEAD/DEAH box helicase [Nostoc sp. C052]
MENIEIGKQFLPGGKYELRDYQKQAISQAYKFFRMGLRSVVIYAPTGAGKTVMAVKTIVDAVKKERRVMFLVHRGKLVKQTVKILQSNGIDVSVIWADWPEPPDYSKSVQIAMVQTLQNRELPSGIGLVIVDEAHTTGFYKLYSQKILETYSNGILALSKCYFLGLTASPWRSKATEGFCHLFQAVVQTAFPQQLIDANRLARSRQFGFDGLIDFKQLDKGKDGDYTQKSMRKACDATYNSEIVRNYLEHCPDRKAIAFCSGIEQTINLTQQFLEHGVSAEFIVKDTPDKERDDIFERFRLGITHCLVSVGVLCEGFDEPSVRAVILARPTKSVALLVQMCGRGLRIFENKDDCYFLDFGENFKRLGFHTKQRETPLCPSGKDDSRSEEPEYKTCPNCQSVIFKYLRICPSCGHVFYETDWEVLPMQPFGELLDPEQKKQVKYFRRYIYNCYWLKNRPEFSILQAERIFYEKYKYYPSDEWSVGAIFQDDNKLKLYYQQLYVRFLRQNCQNPDNIQEAAWIEKMMRKEFGKSDQGEYIPWWKIMGFHRLVDDVEEIKMKYMLQCELYCNTTHGQEKLRLLSLAMCEAMQLGISPGVVVNWRKCPGHLEWMQPFRIVEIDPLEKLAQIDGIRHRIPLEQLVMT